MKRVPSIEGDMQGWVLYGLPDGRSVKLDARAVREFGAAKILHDMGLIPDPATLARKPVYQDGRLAGSVPGAFDPLSIRSQSFLYDVRPGDFVEHGDGWVAHSSLGPGDLEAVPGFVRAQT